MKILVIFPGFNVGGGMTSVVKSFLEKQTENEIDVEFIETYHDSAKIKSLVKFITAFFKMLFSIIFTKYDLVHIHTASKGSFYRKSIFCLLAKFFNIPIVLHMHGGGFKEFYLNKNFIVQAYINFIFQHSIDELIVLSSIWHDWFNGTFNLKKKPKTLKNSVNITCGNKVITTTKNNFKCIFVGRLVKEKGIDDLLAATVNLSSNTGLSIELIGDGEINKYKSIVNDLSLNDKVSFSGWLSNKDSIEKIKQADVLVLPSYKEGLPMVILEAMACKTAIISTNVGGIPNVISNNVNGLLFTPGRIDELERAVNELMTNNELYERIVENAYKDYLNEYQLDAVFPQLIKIYKGVLK